MRRTSMIETALTYATFLTLSIALHVVVILGNRPIETLRLHEAASAPSQPEAAEVPDGGERVK